MQTKHAIFGLLLIAVCILLSLTILRCGGRPVMTTINKQISANKDDWHQPATGSNTDNSIDVQIRSSGAEPLRTWGGFRFTGLTIPKGARVSSATLQLYGGVSTVYDDLNVDI